MAEDVVSIWNRALSAAGSEQSVSDESENSRGANLCRLWYAPVRDAVLKSATWPSASKHVALGLLAERDFSADWSASDPAPNWKYAYSQPSDLLAPRYLTSYARFTRNTLNGTNTIVTNQQQAVLQYIFRQADVTQWDIGLETAVVYALAANISMQLNGVRTKADRLLGLAQEQVLFAQTEIANESDDTHEAIPSWVAVTDYADGLNEQRYIRPHETLNLLAT